MSQRKNIPIAPGVYRASEIIATGTSSNRLRANDVRRIGYGLVVHPDYELDQFSYRDRCMAVGQTLRPEHFLSRRSAAAVYGIPCPQPPKGRVDVGSFSPHRAPRHRLIHGHRVKSGGLLWAVRDELTLPSPADIWCQIAAVVSLPELVAAGDYLLSGERLPDSGGARTPPLCTPSELTIARSRHRNTLGAPARHRAIGLLRTPVDSPPESFIRLILVDAGFDEPVVNCPVATLHRVLHADLGYPDLRIAIEYEGGYHFSSDLQLRRDAIRRKQMVNAGWTVIVAMDDDVTDPSTLIAALAEAIGRARAQLN